MWHLHRRRSDGGYDAISIIFDKKRRPLFDAVINIIAPHGIVLPSGETLAAEKATAVSALARVRVTKRYRRSQSLAAILRWLGYDWFGFQPRKDHTLNKRAAEGACEDFLGCLQQAYRWWETGELGPNLKQENLIIDHSEIPRTPKR